MSCLLPARGASPRAVALDLLLAVVVAACVQQPTAAPGPEGGDEQRGRQLSPLRVLTIGITSQVSAMSIAADSTTVGGWQELAELHANGLHLGPYRLTRLEPGEGVTFEAYGNYFLGRPKVDLIRVRTFADENALFTNLLAGTVDAFPMPAFDPNLGFELKSRWDRSGQGTVYIVRGTTWYITPQWRPSVQAEAANLDRRVRAALYHAIDRDALAEAMQGGHRELAAHSLITPGYRPYGAAKDGLRPFAYDPDRARAMLREAGWLPAPDGAMRNQIDGRPYRTQLWTTMGADIAIIADYWHRVGVHAEEYTLPAGQARNRQYRSNFPGWEASGGSAGDGILSLLKGPVTSAENNWSGNRAGYEDPRAEELVTRYYRSITDRDQFQAMQAVSELVAREQICTGDYPPPQPSPARGEGVFVCPLPRKG